MIHHDLFVAHMLKALQPTRAREIKLKSCVKRFAWRRQPQGDLFDISLGLYLSVYLYFYLSI